jgi:hypothetical protein
VRGRERALEGVSKRCSEGARERGREAVSAPPFSVLVTFHSNLQQQCCRLQGELTGGETPKGKSTRPCA